MAVDDANTIVLLHFNGSDGDTGFSDESGKVWTASGNAQLDTAQKKFGTASGLFDGNGDYISTPDHVDFHFGTGDFTVDFWFRFPAAINTAFVSIGTWPTGLFIYPQGTFVTVAINGSFFNFMSWGATSVNTWYHLAVTRSGTDLRLFVNGVQIGATQTSSQDISTTNTIIVGEAAGGYYDGWMDELRISNVARWTENFTPSAIEYDPGATPKSINATIPVSPLVGGMFIKGLFGDIAANIIVTPVIYGTMEYIPPPQISANISFSPSISGTMSFGATGDASLFLPMFTLSATGTLDIDGTSSLSLPMFILSSEGYDSCFGDADVSLPMFTLDAEVAISEIGNASLTLPMLRLSAEGITNIIGNASISLPMFKLSTSAFIGEIGNLSSTLPMFRVSSEGFDGALGSGDITIPMFTLSSEGFLSVEGTANISLPMFTLFAEVATASTDYKNMVMNLRNNALTLYTNYPFNSFCRFNGVNLGATSTKIFNLNSGTTDNGTLIDWSMKTAFLDMELKTKKKLRMAWLTLKTDGDLTVTISYPDGTSYDYRATGYEITEDGIRVKFGKGLSSRYIAMELSNIDGSSLTLDTIRLQLDQYASKR